MKKTSLSTKQQIIDSGYALFSLKGFTHVGLSEILNAANVPKGSFYHYFSSKEHFGEMVIQQYFKDYLHSIDALFNTVNKSGYLRLNDYWQRWQDAQAPAHHSQQCLVVKLSAEVADLSEPMRLALKIGADEVIRRLTRCIQTGIQDGSVNPIDPSSTANMLYQMWLGASLLNKLYRDGSTIDKAMERTKKILKQE
ncbi:TetR/AcrR family transcriptional regulator [uncultured Shewanella sp.]|uniref:TetR/AcrR family transcriptional regulator n=1 Tax=uncultured Shewanella sp. TaxID=173975 RepID=UPI002628E0C7|nr:TetR/AcrR family transcriptional regulator [uncultured Shewanella sp.]